MIAALQLLPECAEALLPEPGINGALGLGRKSMRRLAGVQLQPPVLRARLRHTFRW